MTTPPSEDAHRACESVAATRPAQGAHARGAVVAEKRRTNGAAAQSGIAGHRLARACGAKSALGYLAARGAPPRGALWRRGENPYERVINVTIAAVRDPDFERRVRDSFARQRFMATLGATLDVVQPGEVHIGFTHRDDLTQQHGYLHAGVLASVADSACGYAALSLMEPGTGVLSVEFKINMLAPAAGARFVAVGRVVRSGRTITVCSGEVRVEDGTSLIAMMQATMMAVRGRAGLTD